ncbi:MAG: YggS family pyridoxal phosphate-dependent enzyme [Bacillota bacterium]
MAENSKQINKEQLIKRYQEVKNKIIESAQKSGRSLENIKLIGVGKNHSIEKINFVRKLGLEGCGESRVQELLDKEEQQPREIDWHFIGHLQRNKVKYLARLNNCKMIHSLDSLRLAKEINKRARKNQRNMSVLVQINIAEDKSKYGFKTKEIHELMPKLDKLNRLNIKGLMTILPYFDDPEKARPYFKELRQIKDNLNKAGYDKLTELSMGMTADYEVAVEEGATYLRIGRGLFGERYS